MSSLVPISLFGWIFVVLVLFSLLPPRRAVIVSFLGAWLFLPVAAISFAGVPDLTKVSVTSVAVLIGVVLVDSGRLLKFKPRWVDLPMLVWCLVPMAASLTNGLGPYDGASAVLDQLVTWGLPYFIGRLYFTDLASLRELAVAVVIGGLIYVPLCAFEVRMSPQLHRLVYGFHAHQFIQTMRWGGYRPMVFMQHGLMVGMWMASATLIGCWLWRNGALRRLFNVPMVAVVGIMVITTILCKSTGALLLLGGGLGLLYGTKFLRSPVLVLCAVMIAPAYVTIRANGLWSGDQVVEAIASVSRERAQSLEVRLENEVRVSQKALEKPVFGWGRWGRWRVFDEFGKDITTSDGMWIIALGRSGIVGLSALLASVLLPIVLLARRIPTRHWSEAAVAPAAVLATVLLMYALDMMLNAMVNPVFMLAAGGLSSLCVAVARPARPVRSAPVAVPPSPRPAPTEATP